MMLHTLKQIYWRQLVRRANRESKSTAITPHDWLGAIARHLPADRDSLVYVDGGAFDGTMARRFARRFNNLHVHAFEPSPQTFKRLQANLQPIAGHAYDIALSDACGQAELNVNQMPGANSLLARGSAGRRYQDRATTLQAKQTVAVTTLDQWAEQAGVERVDILKLDLQGAELAALRGGGRLLDNGIACVFIEVMFVPVYDKQPLFADIDQFMRSAGYRLVNLYNLWTHQRDGQLTSADALYVPADSHPSRLRSDLPTFYSQHGEDYLAWRMCQRDTDKGYYVEVGALDGKRFSNSYAFERLGWDGVCVEAHPQFAQWTQRNRPGAKVVHAACCDSDEQSIIFHANDWGTLSAIEPMDENLLRERFDQYFFGYKPIEVPGRTLTSILDSAGAPHRPDVVSIDVEGAEMMVLRGLDFDRYRPRLLIVEGNDEHDRRTLRAYMGERGYTVARQVAMNLLFCDDATDAAALREQPIDVPLVHTAHPMNADQNDVVQMPVRPESRGVWPRLQRLLAG